MKRIFPLMVAALIVNMLTGTNCKVIILRINNLIMCMIYTNSDSHRLKVLYCYHICNALSTEILFLRIIPGAVKLYYNCS